MKKSYKFKIWCKKNCEVGEVVFLVRIGVFQVNERSYGIEDLITLSKATRLLLVKCYDKKMVKLQGIPL